MDIELAKKTAAQAAANLIQPNSRLGLGSGSTVAYFIEALALRLKRESFSLASVVASSKMSEEQARYFNLPLKDLNEIQTLEVTVDGADEIDSQKRMIKGGGGAHVRERIVASSSEELIVVVDESKLVSALGKTKLPVEILPFGARATQKKLEQLGYYGVWRSNCVTENNNLILDLFFSSPLLFPEEDHQRIRSVPGVIDTGFFFKMAGRVVVAYFNGNIEIR